MMWYHVEKVLQGVPEMLIRRAAFADAPHVAAIYDHYVRCTAVTFATATPSADHYARQMADLRYPFLVCEEEGRVTGFAYAAAFRTKEAYRWGVELTIYLAPDAPRRGGRGRALLEECLSLLRRQGADVVGAAVLFEMLALGGREHWTDTVPLMAAAAY